MPPIKEGTTATKATTIDLTETSPDLEGEVAAGADSTKPKIIKIKRKTKDTTDLPRTLRSNKARPNYAE